MQFYLHFYSKFFCDLMNLLSFAHQSAIRLSLSFYPVILVKYSKLKAHFKLFHIKNFITYSDHGPFASYLTSGSGTKAQIIPEKLIASFIVGLVFIIEIL